jgi:hypothetical protein
VRLAGVAQNDCNRSALLTLRSPTCLGITLLVLRMGPETDQAGAFTVTHH